jgi:NAD-dependent dihydropyrimidine dehydrogenase PreA subunit
MEIPMAYVITGTCTKDELCVEACPVDCIHPKKDEDGFDAAPHLYVNPADCIDCGACVPVCPTNSVFPIDDLPAELAGVRRAERSPLQLNCQFENQIRAG